MLCYTNFKIYSIYVYRFYFAFWLGLLNATIVRHNVKQRIFMRDVKVCVERTQNS